MGCLLLLNTALFVNCVWRLRLHRIDKDRLSRGGKGQLWRRHSKNRGLDDGKAQLQLHLKLFAVMGLSWVFEVVSWLVQAEEQADSFSASAADFEEADCLPWYLWTDLINALQGVWMLLIYVCKRDVWEKLRTRLMPCSCYE